MSEQVVETGKLKLVSKDLTKFLKGYFGEEVYQQKLDEHSSDSEIFDWEGLYDNFVIVKGGIYSLEDYKNLDSCDVFHASKLTDGRIEFVVSYYNGVCSLNEALEYAVEKMEENK